MMRVMYTTFLYFIVVTSRNNKLNIKMITIIKSFIHFLIRNKNKNNELIFYYFI